MMKKEFLIAGFGGQGVLSMGLFLAYGGIAEGKKVTYVPSYGAEMRGGTANCLVILSDRDISSPLISDPGIVIAMNQPSLAKFEPVVRPGGVLLINSSLAHRPAERQDITSYSIPAQEIANQVGLPRGANMVMLGALLEISKVLDFAASEDYLVKTFRGKYLNMMPLNLAAMEAGAQFIRNF
ncbi:MAG: 2-oxoacid:acceptor oxidoreductase family protein [Syntrophothermus sp.]|uniref:2-oxoacid:acceptor oxidoreductase family protein n=1 Tax=Syntrophothermus sp. TaxID=2736299 RepID=UPI00257B19AB|nr:2-oxoacid:acceptor oxidoreductase family protein [Syntrophothermus sp.]NSW83447.1 2-oxoacid:acceptor oxidoreductase family protein [Syntrophothermus sp.]